MAQLFIGFGDLKRGWAALRAHPVVWKWIAAPAVITLVLIAALVAAILHFADPLAAWLGAHLHGLIPGIGGALVEALVVTLIEALIVVVLSLTGLSLFVSIAGMVAGPFNELLSEHLEAALTGRPPPPFALASFLHGAALGVAHGVRRLLVLLFGLIAMFVIGLVPVIGTIAAPAFGLWLAASGAAYDCYDAVLSRRTLGYRAKLAYLARHRTRTLGLGLGVTGLLLVPVINLVALGVGAAGATVAALALDRGSPGPRDPRSSR